MHRKVLGAYLAVGKRDVPEIALSGEIACYLLERAIMMALLREKREAATSGKVATPIKPITKARRTGNLYPIAIQSPQIPTPEPRPELQRTS